MANQLLMPDMLGAVNRGVEYGKQNRLAKLAGQAYTTAPEGRNALLGEIASISPQAAQRIQTGFQANQAAEQKIEINHAKRLNGAATYVARAAKQSEETGNPAMVEGAFQAVRPYLAQLTGKPIPEHWDPQMLPLVYQAIAQTGGDNLSDAPSQVQAFKYMTQGLTPEEAAEARKINLGLAPRQSSAAIKYKEVMGSDGRKRLVAMDPREVGVQVVGQGGGFQQSAPAPQASMDSLLAEANERVQNGENPDEVEAWLRQQAAQAGMQPQTAPASAGGGNAFTSPTEAQSAYNKAQATNQAETEAMRARLPIEQQKAQQKADIAKQAKGREVRKGLVSTTSLLDRLANAAKELRDAPGLSGIVGVEGHFPDYPGGEAAHARALLETLKSQIGFGVLQNMREMSPTGGALGQVSEMENRLLQQNLAALGTNQSEADFKKSLNKVIQYANDSKNRLQRAYQTTYGDSSDSQGVMPPGGTVPRSGGDVSQQGAQQQPGGLSPGAVEDGYRFTGGDPSDPNNWEQI